MYFEPVSINAVCTVEATSPAGNDVFYDVSASDPAAPDTNPGSGSTSISCTDVEGVGTGASKTQAAAIQVINAQNDPDETFPGGFGGPTLTDVICSATDAVKNKSADVKVTVKIQDTTAPIIESPQNPATITSIVGRHSYRCNRSR